MRNDDTTIRRQDERREEGEHFDFPNILWYKVSNSIFFTKYIHDKQINQLTFITTYNFSLIRIKF